MQGGARRGLSETSVAAVTGTQVDDEDRPVVGLSEVNPDEGEFQSGLPLTFFSFCGGDALVEPVNRAI